VTELIVALDGDARHAWAVFDLLNDKTDIRWFKIGPQVLVQEKGWALANEIVRRGTSLFLDLKLYDTADTVTAAARRSFDLGAKMLTVVANPRLLLAAARASRRYDQKIIALTSALTDGDGADYVWMTSTALEMADGWVSSVRALEHTTMRSALEEGKIVVCPGVRVDIDLTSDEHTYPATPEQAVSAGAHYIVVGRPIVGVNDPVAAERKFAERMRGHVC
jgi:orotidine-5'-phosphate decarboxylase